ncbi:hypothetical protein VTN77DRAFT_7761 [Rasamsonia byssochlamydoides]|uniref:uncharacterized protein n=1 Tax=Rasamsonia byssochlamydoides TaxID=89139 RepID=UPI003743F30F
MEIDYSHGAQQEKLAINFILNSLWDTPNLCPGNGTTNSSTEFGLTAEASQNLMGNVTVSLFSSMGITPSKGALAQFGSTQLLMMYINLLGFVYMYYFVGVALAMMHFAVFTFLTRRHPNQVHNGIAIGTRLVFGIFLLSLVSFTWNFDLTYFFMTSPMIIFTFSLTLVKGEFVAFALFYACPYSLKCSSPCRSIFGLASGPEEWGCCSIWQQEQYSTDGSSGIRDRLHFV